MLAGSVAILISCFFFFVFTCFFAISSALDTLAPTQELRHGKTLVSAGNTFELGFFEIKKTRLWYLGIWYKKVSTGTVVWVANREIPLNDTSGVVLKFDERGVLVLLNQDNTTVWSSNTATFGNNPVAQIFDSGNLVVRSDNYGLLWQSFDHPGNTFLPGMKIGSRIAGLDVSVSSWKSIDNPSQGNYTFQLDSTGLELATKQGSIVKVRSGPWIGIGFSGLPYVRTNPIYSISFVFNEKERYYITKLVNMSVFSRMVLNPDGVIQRFTWIDRTGEWSLYMGAPADYCDTFELCGAYGNCDIGNAPVCGCLNGFVPKYQKDWNKADWSNGCVRKVALNCQKGDGFRLYPNVKLPYMENSFFNASMNLEECRTKCLGNCSCMAFANSDIRGNGSGCYLWYGDLIDIKQYKENGQGLYVRMASSEIVASTLGGSKKTNRRRWIILISALSMAMLLFGLIVGLNAWKKKRSRLNRPRQEGILDNKKDAIEVLNFDLTTIVTATNNFSFNNMLGKGGFGVVYKGTLDNGLEIAVKRLSQNSRQGLDEFKNEVNCIAKLQHRNLVKLLGYCTQLEEKMLIYEYMPNKSLDYYIFDQVQSMALDWPKRFHIINGICKGLLYLHQDSRLRIVHRDLKLSNILLDDEMNPKISDFGMARIFGANETEANTNRVVGTYGYMSPEYAVDGQFSIKSDVFSFGVLMLEIVSGKKNRGFRHPDHQLNLLGHAWTRFNEGRSIELADAMMAESCNWLEVSRSIHIGLLCVQKSPEDRPNMSSVVLMLGGEGVLPQPKEPGFFTERKLVKSKSFSSTSEPCSANEMTLSLMTGR